MGQKVHPEGNRLKINRTWSSRWYARGKEYRGFLLEDLAIRHFLEKRLRNAAVSKIIIQRLHKRCLIEIHTARPGVIIGRKGADIIVLRQQLKNMTSLCEDVRIQLIEERKPEINATLIADSIARQLEKRVMFRRAMKRALQMAMRLGAKGIRIECSGRLGGIEIARREWYRNGCVPLHTFRADIDYASATACTTYGTCGVKVWVYKGEVVHYDVANEKVLYAGQTEKEDSSVSVPLSVA